MAEHDTITDFLKYSLTAICDKDSFSIEVKTEDSGTLLYLISVQPEFMGLVIGKGGKNVESLRNLVNSIARREEKQVVLKVVESVSSE